MEGALKLAGNATLFLLRSLSSFSFALLINAWAA
jgi:hypothetical protein